MAPRAPAWARDLLHDAASAVRGAVLDAVRSGRADLAHVVRMGADGTDTKLVDEVADKALLASVRDSGRPVRVLSEESGWSGSGDWVVVADPVDGTRNATHRVPFYCVSLALGRTTLSDVEQGLVVNIPTGEAYWAERGAGATLDGRRVAVRPFDRREVLVSAVLDEDFPEALRRPHRHFRDMGASALEMCLVASGGFDAFFNHSRHIRIIDIAASTLIVREAGGVVTDLSGRDLDMPFDLAARAALAAASSRAALQEVLA